VEDTSTILLVMEQETNAKTCASLVLRLEAGPPRWSQIESAQASELHPHTRLWRGVEIATEVVRSRIQIEADFHSLNCSDGTNGMKIPVILKLCDEHSRSKIPALPEGTSTSEPILTNAVFTI
jgi:hypothetical protein